MSERLRKLIPTLVERTVAGEMEWQSLGTSPDSYVHLLDGGGALMVTRIGEALKLQLLNPSLTDIDSEIEDEEGGQLANLVAILRRRALKIDDTFESLEKELGL